jgi:hypothetical protein
MREKKERKKKGKRGGRTGDELREKKEKKKEKRKEMRRGMDWAGNERKGRWYVGGGKKKKEKRKRIEEGDIQRVERERQEENRKCRYFEYCEINK